MKTKIVSIVVIISLFIFFSCKNISKDKEAVIEEKEESVKTTEKQLRHVVLFKFKETVSSDSIAYVEKAFAELPSKISEIKEFEWGTDNSVEELSNGFTHSFLLTFGSEEGRAKYFPHPDHQAFVKIVTPLLEDVLVVDYWAKD